MSINRTMNRIEWGLIFLAGILVLCPGERWIRAGQAWADEYEVEVSLDQLPQKVRATIEKAAEGGTIEEIEKEIEDGKTVYEADVVIDGKEYEIEVSERGVLLSKELEEEESREEADENDENSLRVDFESTPVGQVPEGCLIAETAGTGKKGTWKVIEMDDAPSGTKVLALVETRNSGHTFNLAIAESIHVKDLEIEVKLKPISGEEDQGGGPIWRVQDPNNYYIARWNPLEENFRVYYVKDGHRKQLASAKVKADPTKWHEIEVEMVGDRIEAEFDDEKLIEVEDDTFTSAGMVGVWTKADAATAFDDFEVEKESGHEEHHHRRGHDH